jgi:uncharacterized membrane protein
MSIRNKAAELTDNEKDFRWRSHDSSRLEAFSDSVFAFAITLVIVSTAVPKSFDELYETMKGTLSFAVCFLVLFLMWNQQNVFFRRYGLKGGYITFLNAVLLFVVLMYAYPLKFLFFLVLTSKTYVLNGQIHPVIYPSQQPTLMMIYGAGFTVIYTLFFLMYLHAEKNANALELTPKEKFITRTTTSANFQLIIVGIVAFAAAYFVPVEYAGYTGYIYLIVPFKRFLWRTYRDKKQRKLYGAVN